MGQMMTGQWVNEYGNLNASGWYIYRIYLLFNQSYDIKVIVSQCADISVILFSQQEHLTQNRKNRFLCQVI